MNENIKNALKTGIEFVKTYGCGCDHEMGFMCAECCLISAISDALKEIQSLEAELEQLKKENLTMRNCENCFHFDVLNECNLNSISCIKLDKWELKK